MDKSLLINVERTDNFLTVINLKGFMNLYSKESFIETIADVKNRSKNFIFLIDELEYVSSSGIGSFMELYETVNEKNGTICFCGMKEPVKRIFDLMGFLSFFCEKSSLNEAVEYISKN